MKAIDPREKTLPMWSIAELEALRVKMKFLLQVTEQADCRSVYIAALHGLRAKRSSPG
jgi:hypothetical protein